MTVFRKLKPLGYRTSYSHRGKYYTLPGTPRFDEHDVWDYAGVWFSRHGNLLATSQRLVETADAGWTAAELGHLLHVEVKEPLLRLYRAKQIEREKIEDRYVYLARDPGQRRSQRSAPGGPASRGRDRRIGDRGCLSRVESGDRVVLQSAR